MRRPDRHVPAPDQAAELAAIDAELAGQAVDSRHADLARLARRLSDEAPRMRPAFAARLDARVASGLAQARARRTRRGPLALLLRPDRRWAIAGAVGSVLLAVVIGAAALRQSGHGRVDTFVTASKPAASSTTEGIVSTSSAADARGHEAASAVAPQRLVPPRAVERSTELTLAAPAEDIARVSDRVLATADRFGAIVERSAINTDDAGGGGSSFELRVSAARVQPALAALSRLAHVRSRSDASLDIAAPTRSAAARLAEARANRSSLLRQLARATTPNQAASIRTRLHLADARIARLAAESASLARRAGFSRVSVTVASTGRRPAAHRRGGGAWGPGDAWHDVRRLLSGAAAVAVLTAGVAVPLLILVTAGIVAARVARRRRREQALGAS